MSLDDESKLFNIHIAAQMSGVTAHTIRAWEKRYKALQPARNINGRRAYTQTEVERLTLLMKITKLGSSISHIANLPDNELKKIYAKLNAFQNPLSSAKNDLLSPFSTSIIKEQLKEALQNFEIDSLSQILDETSKTYSPRDLALQIIEPLIREVEELEKSMSMKTARSSALHALLKFKVGQILNAHYEMNLRSLNKIVLTTLEGSHKTLSLLMSSLLCCHHGLTLYYFSANLPTISLAEAVLATGSTVIILGIDPLEDDWEVEMKLQQIRTLVPAKTLIWLVGRPELSIPGTRSFKDPEELDYALNQIQ